MDADESYRHYWNSLLVLPWEDEVSPQPWLTRLLLCDSLIQNNGLLHWLEEEEAEGDLDAMVDACQRLGIPDLAEHLRAAGVAVDVADPATYSDALEEQLDPPYFALSELIGPAVRRWWEAHEAGPSA